MTIFRNQTFCSFGFIALTAILIFLAFAWIDDALAFLLVASGLLGISFFVRKGINQLIGNG